MPGEGTPHLFNSETARETTAHLLPWKARSSYPLLETLDKEFALPANRDGRPITIDIQVNPNAYAVADEAAAVLVCSDERLNEVDWRALFPRLSGSIRLVRVPGARIGFSDEEMKAMAGLLKKAGAPLVYATSHEDCGAARAEADARGIADHERYAQEAVKTLQEDCGIEYLGYVPAAIAPALSRPHPGLCLMVDGTGRRNELYDGQLPREAFVVTATVYDRADVLKAHIKTLVSIALGHHGYGLAEDHSTVGFSSEHPFYVFVAADQERDLVKYFSVAEEAIGGLPDAVRIVGFIAP